MGLIQQQRPATEGFLLDFWRGWCPSLCESSCRRTRLGHSPRCRTGAAGRGGCDGACPSSAPSLSPFASPILPGCLWFEQSKMPGGRKSSVSSADKIIWIQPRLMQDLCREETTARTLLCLCFPQKRKKAARCWAQPGPSPGASRAVASGSGGSPVRGKAPAFTLSWVKSC